VAWIVKRKLRVALAQINTIVGDFSYNRDKILQSVDRAKEGQADIIAFPELTICGYPPEDLLLKPAFVNDNLKYLAEITNQIDNIVTIVGFVDRQEDIYNAAAVIYNQQLIFTYHKVHLPNYGVFDEYRYFQAGTEFPVLRLNGSTVAVTICEDIWLPGDPIQTQVVEGDTEIIINISASPYHFGKSQLRERMLATRASDNAAAIAFVNLVGGQDELVFDGRSLVFDQKGELIAAAKQFAEDLVLVDIDVEAIFRERLRDPRLRELRREARRKGRKVSVYTVHLADHPKKVKVEAKKTASLTKPAEVYQALVLGTRDYVEKNKFEKVVIGLSGGIDSSLTATVAVDALGSENVIGVYLPSLYSSKESAEDAKLLSENLGIKFLEIAIDKVFKALLEVLKPVFADHKQDVTEENIQARVRGLILMALSNKFGWLVLSTGNKSEMSTGYCTLYGDMAGGFSVLKDVPKTLVYELARYRNKAAKREIIPARVLIKEPSAELRPDQRDSDTLPPYHLLDQVIQKYVENDLSFEEIVANGFSPSLVKKVFKLVDKSEYKRRQGPPGIKITPRAFGKDRRLPITSRYNGF
jgi:NAD+ synthase (glutamine-hydrolysing)